jgi:hypothetical protein
MQVKSSLTNATQQRNEHNQTHEVSGAACVILSLSLSRSLARRRLSSLLNPDFT